MKRVIACLFMLLFMFVFGQAHSTQIVLIATKDGVVAGSDTRDVTAATGKNGSVEKLHWIPDRNIVFGIAGMAKLVSSDGKITAYDANEIALQFFEDHKGRALSQSLLDELARTLMMSLGNILPHLRLDPASSDKLRGFDVCQISLAQYFDATRSFLFGSCDVFIDANLKIKTKPSELFPVDQTSKVFYLMSPSVATLERFPDSRFQRKASPNFRTIYQKKAPVGAISGQKAANFAQEVLTEAEKADEKWIGKPFEVYLMDGKGRWLPLKPTLK